MDHYKDKVIDEQGLISVSEALRAMACGRVIQCSSKDFPNWKDMEITNINAKNLIDEERINKNGLKYSCLLYTSPSPRDRQKSRMPSSA